MNFSYQDAFRNDTTATGIDVTGSVTADGLTFGSNNRIQGTGGLFIGGSTATVFEVGAGTEKMRLTSTGLGIGTSSPSATLEVNGVPNATIQPSNAIIKMNSSGGNGLYMGNVGASSYASYIQAAFVSADSPNVNYKLLLQPNGGNVGIGTSSPAQKLHIGGTGFSYLRTTSTSYGGTGFDIGQHTGGSIYLNNRDNTPIIFQTNNTERMRIDASGNLLVGKTTTGLADAGFEVQSSGQITANQANAPAAKFNRLTNDGEIIRLHKDGTTVGSIGTSNSDLVIGTGTANLWFDDGANRFNPASSITLGASDGVISFGSSGRRFKDIYLSGGVRNVNGDGFNVGTSGGEPILMPADTSGVLNGQGSLGLPSSRWKDLYLSGKAIVGAGSASAPSITASNDTDAGLFWGGGFLGFTGGSSNQMRLDSSGNLLVGISSFASAGGGHLLAPSGTRSSSRTVTTAAFHNLFYNANGIVGGISTSGSATTYATSSDQRLKENIADADDAGSKIDAIQVRKFDWKADGSHQDYGMVAQELQSVAPEAVSARRDSEENDGRGLQQASPNDAQRNSITTRTSRTTRILKEKQHGNSMANQSNGKNACRRWRSRMSLAS